jgi:hypothetical protein
MRRLAFLLVLAFAAPVFAQDEDAPVPYDDDSSNAKPADDEKPAHHKKKKSKKQRRDDDFRVAEEEDAALEETMAHVDDPNIGVGFELSSGAMLIESSRGALVDPRFGFGVRAVWEFGRLIPDETLREMFFADLGYSYAATHDGTPGVYTDANYHYFSLAPAVALPLGPKSPFSFYAQGGIGVSYDFSSLHIPGSTPAETQLSGTKLLLQYGVGFRARPALVDDQSLRLTIRIEVMRYVRGYMTDTLLGGAVGLIF